MTDTPPPAAPDEPTPVTPPPAPMPPAATPPAATPPVAPPPAATPVPAAPAAAGPKQTLSLVSFILGIASFVLSWFIGLGLIPGIVAVILGFQGRKKEPGAPKWMSLVGIIGGFVGIGISIIFGLIWIIGLVVYFAAVGSITDGYNFNY